MACADSLSDKVSNIDEKSIEIESFVGRMMNHQAELMAWREELPVHLQIRNSEGSVNRTTFDFQCAEIELREYPCISNSFGHFLYAHMPLF
jgi:hypothetical protein